MVRKLILAAAATAALCLGAAAPALATAVPAAGPPARHHVQLYGVITSHGIVWSTKDPDYYMVDNYGNNICCGALEDLGHNQRVATFQSAANNTYQAFYLATGDGTGWYGLFFRADSLALNVGSDGYVYEDSWQNTTSENWKLIGLTGGNWALENRHTGKYLGAVSYSTGSQVTAELGAVDGRGAWYFYTSGV